MKPKGNSRFILRAIRKEDEADIVKNINDKIISRNTASIPYPYKPKDAKKWIEKCLKHQKNKESGEISLAIIINGEVAGSIGLHKIVKKHKAEIGYWLARKHWGKGIMSEVIKLVTDWGFKKMKLKRIYAQVFSFNLPSMRVLEKNGYQFEGIKRKEVKKEKKYIDAHLFAKIK